MRTATCDERGLIDVITADGRPLLALTGFCLMLAGAFAALQSITGEFLPHDVRYLGMTARHLCQVNECRVVHFMIHDRVSFGGAIFAIGVLYIWLAAFPLRRGEAWAWWLFLVSGGIGFGSFFAFLGYGYLDTWHAVATLALLLGYVAGLLRVYPTLRGPLGFSTLSRPANWGSWRSRLGLGRALLLVAGLGLTGGGLTILVVGTTAVFVPQDLDYMGMTAAQLDAINPRLVPLIAHDRAGFGGAVCCAGVTLSFCVWCARPSRALWQALLIAGAVGFTTAIGVHPAVGYTDMVHLAPAIVGATIYFAGLILIRTR